MSRFLEISSPQLLAQLAPYEQFAHWGEEEHAFEPRRFQFGSLSLRLVDIPTHLRPWMSFGQSVQTCIEMDAKVVYDWSSTSEPALDVRRLLELVTTSPEWVVVYESDRGEGTDQRTSSPALLFDAVDRLLQNTHESLTILRPDASTP